jgi:hypothetical protein
MRINLSFCHCLMQIVIGLALLAKTIVTYLLLIGFWAREGHFINSFLNLINYLFTFFRFCIFMLPICRGSSSMHFTYLTLFIIKLKLHPIVFLIFIFIRFYKFIWDVFSRCYFNVFWVIFQLLRIYFSISPNFVLIFPFLN